MSLGLILVIILVIFLLGGFVTTWADLETGGSWADRCEWCGYQTAL
jgi:hypothetical protein